MGSGRDKVMTRSSAGDGQGLRESFREETATAAAVAVVVVDARPTLPPDAVFLPGKNAAAALQSQPPTHHHPKPTQNPQRKSAKKKKGEAAAGVGATKTERKTARNAEKAGRRAERALAGDEDDIDALLAQFAIQEKAKKGVSVDADCPPPGPRVNASLVAHITPRATELVLFGGEVVDLATGKVLVNADLYRYDCDRSKWSRVRSPGGPSPRCAHQAVAFKGCMYAFGGEFSSPNQERFMHFR